MSRGWNMQAIDRWYRDHRQSEWFMNNYLGVVLGLFIYLVIKTPGGVNRMDVL